MQRRQLLKQSAFAIAAFSFSRELFANASITNLDINSSTLIRLGSNENPHGPSTLAKQAMIEAVGISNRYQWDMNTVIKNRNCKNDWSHKRPCCLRGRLI